MLMEDTIQRWTACVDARALETCRLDSMDGWFLLGLFLLVLLAIYACRKVLTLILTWRAVALMPVLVAPPVKMGEIL